MREERDGRRRATVNLVGAAGFSAVPAAAAGVVEWRLGLVVIGVALLFAWLIWWTFIPRFIWDVLIVGTYNGIVWIVGLFSGGGSTEVAVAVVTQVPDVVPSPSPARVSAALAVPVAAAALVGTHGATGCSARCWTWSFRHGAALGV